MGVAIAKTVVVVVRLVIFYKFERGQFFLMTLSRERESKLGRPYLFLLHLYINNSESVFVYLFHIYIYIFIRES